MTKAVRIVVADDHSMFRQALIEMLRTVDDFEVVGDAASSDVAVDLIRDLTPDVAILDVAMPGPGAVETLRLAHRESPTTRVVIVTMFDEPRVIRDLIEAGAVAYLLKSSDRIELATAVRIAARDDDMVLVSVSRQALLGLSQTGTTNSTLLSPRELDVLQLLVDARRNHDIATTLRISDATAKRHLSNIYTKLGAKSRAEAVHRARQLGLVRDQLPT